MPSSVLQAPPIRRQTRRRPRPDLLHWPKGWEFQVRPALDTDGEAIHALVDQMTQAQGWKLPECDWSMIAPFWYVADLKGWLIGAVQVCVGRPMSRIELLSVHQQISHTKQAKVAKSLLARAVSALQVDGSSMACGVVTGAENGFVRVVERCGARCAIKGVVVSYPFKQKESGYGI